MKLLVTRRLPETVMAALDGEFDVTARDVPRPMTTEEARAAIAEFDAILPTLGDGFGAGAFGGETRCKILANFGVGYNHIDAGAAKAAGMVVTNTPGAVTDATADIAMMLVLMSCRRAGEGERMVRRGEWTGWHPVQMLGFHLGGKTLGIIGMGRIGQAVAKRAHDGFGMEVVYYNRSSKDVAHRRLDTVTEVMAAADVVVLAVPATADTHHIIGAAELAAMKPHGRLVNIARGDVVDEAALIVALESGAIGGAGLDVYEREPAVPEALRAMENVVLLPHLGTAALEVRENMGLMAVDNLRAFARGETPPNLV